MPFNTETSIRSRFPRPVAVAALAVMLSAGLAGCGGGGGSGGGAQVTIVPDPQTLEEIPQTLEEVPQAEAEQAPPVSAEEAPPVSAEEFPNPVALVPSSTQTGPDLVAGSAEAGSASLVTEASFILGAMVRNVGNRASPATYATLYRSRDARITRSDAGLFSEKVGKLPPLQTQYVWKRIHAPSTPGTYYYGACVEEVAGESNTANNCGKALRITVRRSARTDLSFGSPSISPAGPAAGGTFSLRANLKNAGQRVTSIQLRYYRSSDATFTSSDPQVGGEWVSEVPSHGQYGASQILRTPSSTGTYYYRVCADAAEGESNTANNCSSAVKVVLTHNKPNLQIRSTSVSDWRGDRFPIAVEVHNIGGPSPLTSVNFYQSTDRTFTTSDTLVGSVEVPALQSTPSRIVPRFNSGNVLVRPPATGTHHYGACVVAVADESNTGDNCAFIYTIWR